MDISCHWSQSFEQILCIPAYFSHTHAHSHAHMNTHMLPTLSEAWGNFWHFCSLSLKKSAPLLLFSLMLPPVLVCPYIMALLLLIVFLQKVFLSFWTLPATPAVEISWISTQHKQRTCAFLLVSSTTVTVQILCVFYNNEHGTVAVRLKPIHSRKCTINAHPFLSACIPVNPLLLNRQQ